MVTTGARVRSLATLLTDAGWKPTAPPRLPRLHDLPASQQATIRTLYDLLGGARDQFDRIRPGGWDLAFTTPDGVLLIELDEEQHFNRYRAETLEATVDLDLPWTADYRHHSDTHEARLLPGWGTGKRWTNPSAARFFGEPSAPGDFTGVGAPRWRQRAFYDSVKDVVGERRLSRISVHDRLDTGEAVETLLRRPDPTATTATTTTASRHSVNGAPQRRRFSTPNAQPTRKASRRHSRR